METIHVQLPGAKVIERTAGIKIKDIASSEGINSNIIAAKIDGVAVDLDHIVSKDCELDWISLDSLEGLDILRHSTAHLMAQAVQGLFPNTQVTIGPTTDDGFYYDFKRDKPFTIEDLEIIETRMQELAHQDFKVQREEVEREEAIQFYRNNGEDFKVEILNDIPDARVSFYRQSDWVDLCRGPHVPSTGIIQAFKLTSIAGAYWRGSEKNEMLQRIYGTSFPTKQLLQEHLRLLEEAQKRDHRRLGRELDLFSFNPIAPASPFFHPKGTIIYNELISYIRRLYLRDGYEEVVTPQVYDIDLWHRSGHYHHFRDNMYFTQIDDHQFGVKPMNCPGHTFIYASKKRSYRDLPLRLADFGRLHRYEKSGVTAGLTRVRSFSQDDAHIFCTPEQIKDEITTLLKMVDEVYKTFRFKEMKVKLSTRPEQFLGNEETWEKAENSLAHALQESEIEYLVNDGEGAFYGPKIDFEVLDAMKRSWQLSTIQLDFSMPERFDLIYVAPSGAEQRPVIIHRAILGSIERFMGILIEHTAGVLPLWLAPVQLKVVTVTDQQNTYARNIYSELKASGWRVELDERNEKLGYKVREAQLAKIPYTAVIGNNEVNNHTVSLRRRGGENLKPMPFNELMNFLKKEIASEFGEK